MNRKNFYIILFCVIVAALGFSFAAQLRTQTITQEACPEGNCETIVKEYEYLPIEDDHSEDQNPSESEGATVVEKTTGLANENVETDSNTIYNRSVFIAGQNVTAQQLDINGMIFAAGLKVRATGKQQSIAAAGDTVVLDSVTHQEAYLAGREVELTRNSSVRDLFVVGETVTIRGVVRGDIFSGAERIIVEDATILGDANFAAANIEFRGDNMIHGTLRYDSTAKVQALDESTVGGIATYVVPDATHDVWFIIFNFAAGVCSMISCIAIFIVFLVRISKKQYERFIENKSAVKDAGIGFVALIVVPSAILLLLSFSFLALINIVLVLALAIAFVLSIAIAAARLGKFVNSNILKAKDSSQYQIAMLGAVTFSLIWAIPVFGSAFDFILLIAGFGYVCGEVIHAVVKKDKSAKVSAKKK